MGGAVAGAIIAGTGNAAAAAYAGAAAESIVNEAVSYIPFVSTKLNGQASVKKVTKKNVQSSLSNVVSDTIIEGTESYIAGKILGPIANKIIPTNNGWFTPTKFTSSFIGKYALKNHGQSAVESGLSVCYDMVEHEINERLVQQPTAPLYPDTEISAMR